LLWLSDTAPTLCLIARFTAPVTPPVRIMLQAFEAGAFRRTGRRPFRRRQTSAPILPTHDHVRRTAQTPCNPRPPGRYTGCLSVIA
jgi:hypothetical protein